MKSNLHLSHFTRGQSLAFDLNHDPCAITSDQGVLTEGNITAYGVSIFRLLFTNGFSRLKRLPAINMRKKPGINPSYTHLLNTSSSSLPILILTPESGQGENPLLPLARLTVLFFAESPEKKFGSN